jgi:HAE1 family hydrophobic/amphiphilic exporter-1
VQADAAFRSQPKDIHQFYVRSTGGQVIPLDTVARTQTVTAPQTISHYNLFRSSEIDGSPAPGYSTGEALRAMEKAAKKALAPGMSFEWTGLSLEQIESRGQTLALFVLGLVFVYLVLAAQYESFVLPFIILLSVPLAILGALGGELIAGHANDVFCQIGLVMLIGLAAKNAILIVEFAEQLRRRGRSVTDAALRAAVVRLRPILMTSLAFILGVVPLVLASGAGANARRSLGTAVFGGMIVATALNLFFTPFLYVMVQSLRQRRSPAAQPAHANVAYANFSGDTDETTNVARKDDETLIS